MQIKNRWAGSILYEGEWDTVAEAVLAALKSRANLSGADLSWADLSRANLYGADLSRANLYVANLSRANLYVADLYGADLYGAIGVNRYLSTPLLILHEQPGQIRAYKLTDADGGSPISNSAPLWYKIGATLERPDANSDVSEHCAAGINLCTLDWAIREWREGWRIFLCEFTAADIAAIPTATDGKFRVRRCTVVAEKDVKEYGLGVKPETATTEGATP